MLCLLMLRCYMPTCYMYIIYTVYTGCIIYSVYISFVVMLIQVGRCGRHNLVILTKYG